MKNLYELTSKYTRGSLESTTVVRYDEVDKDVIQGFYSHTLTKLSPDTLIEWYDGNSWERLTVLECMKLELDTHDLAIIFE